MKILEQHQFNVLELQEQVTLSTVCGKYLLSRNEEFYIVKLYQIDNFYAEIWTNRRKGDALHVRTFVDVKNLDPYLDKIKLPNP